MIAWLESLPTLAAGLLIVGGFVVSTLVAGYLVARYTPGDIRLEHNDRAGFILAVIGVVYAVLLAFVAIGTWERFNQAEARSYEESEALATVYRDAESFPDAAPLRAMLRAYVRSVIDDEWPRMRRGQRGTASNALLEAADQVRPSLTGRFGRGPGRSRADAFGDGHGACRPGDPPDDRLHRH